MVVSSPSSLPQEYEPPLLPVQSMPNIIFTSPPKWSGMQTCRGGAASVSFNDGAEGESAKMRGLRPACSCAAAGCDAFQNLPMVWTRLWTLAAPHMIRVGVGKPLQRSRKHQGCAGSPADADT